MNPRVLVGFALAASVGCAQQRQVWFTRDLDDTGYYQDVIAWTRVVADAVGAPDHVVFQSFSESATGSFDVPLNLPEDDPSASSHSRLLNEAFQILKR